MTTEELYQLLEEAAAIIEDGAALMTDDQLRQWAGHGAVLHVIYHVLHQVSSDACISADKAK